MNCAELTGLGDAKMRLKHLAMALFKMSNSCIPRLLAVRRVPLGGLSLAGQGCCAALCHW